MYKSIWASILFALTATPSYAHFVLLVPSADGKNAIAILSDSLKPDDAVDVGKIGGTKLMVRRSGAADAPVAWTKDAHSYKFAIPGDGPRQVFGITDYGVMQRGESKPFLLQYQSKAVVGDWSKFEPLGKPLSVEIVPVRSSNGVRFRALAGGQPIANADVTVMPPDNADSTKVKTDSEGLTPEFKSAGQYGAWVSHSEPKSGEHGGKKYEEIRRYATVVVTVPK
jgi:uncharacterized GH25 family protein